MRGAVAALGLVLAGWPATAIGQTAITADVAGGRALGTTVGQAGAVFSIDGGTLAGANLFHSFSRFDLAAGDTARWVRGAGDGGTIANVVNRVTGGQASNLSGTIDSTALPNAAFWFINPAGIVFGAGAQLNVPGAAHFSTASELRFADGARFAVAAPDGSTLSMAAPEAFGFVGAQAAISISGVGLEFVPGNPNLSFTASDITVSGATFVSGGLDLTAVGDGAAQVRVADPLAGAYAGTIQIRDSTLNAAAADTPGGPVRLGGGRIDLASTRLATITTGAAPGADLQLVADTIRLAPDSLIITAASGDGDGGDVLVQGGLIEVDSRAATTTTGFTSVATAFGGAGAISLQADTIRLIGETSNPTGSGFPFIGSTVLGAGDAGDITLTATNIDIDVALISSSSVGAGEGGDIRISAPNQQLGGATVLTAAFGDGNPGNVAIDGDRIAISGGQFGAAPGSRQASGALTINATTSIESDGGGFLAVSANPTSFGSITLRAPLILLSQGRINTQAFDNGLAGQILVEADTLLLDRVFLTSDAADGPAATGLVRLRASGDLYMLQGSYTASVTGTADGGRIEISGRDVNLDGAIIQTDTGGFGTGDAGQISISAVNSLTIANAAGISSSSGGEGRGGNVALSARDIRIDNASEVLSESRFAGDAGQIAISATGSLEINLSNVFSRAVAGIGNGGSVRVEAGRLVMTDSTLASDSFSFGRAGTVDVRANEIDLDGGNRGFTAISSDALGPGDAGLVTINAGKLTVRNAAVISSSSFSDGDAGDVSIVARDLAVLNSGAISSTGFFAGDAGDISIVADTVLIQGEEGLPTVITSAGVSGGNAGDVTLQARSLTLDSAAISSDTFAGGDAGDLRIRADAVVLKNFSAISSSTNSFGDAGSVEIDAGALSVLDGSLILSAATSVSDGDAGQITIRGDEIVVGQDATITTATFGRGNAGAVGIVAKSLLVDGGDVSSSAGVGSTGFASTVDIVADDLSVINRGSITTLSANENMAGAVTIVAGRVDVDGEFSIISSENIADDRGDAGTVRLTAGNLRIANGGAISTNSVAGAAGDIDIRIDRPGLLVLEGDELPGLILTSSGPGTGGKITITDPLAIISNGGRILALGQQRGANVVIQSRYFINSTDRRNVVEVDGDFQLETGLYDVSSGITSRDISVLDASKVLRGQCPAARSTGAVSQLITRPVGPYAREGAIDVLERPLGSAAPGGCP